MSAAATDEVERPRSKRARKAPSRHDDFESEEDQRKKARKAKVVARANARTAAAAPRRRPASRAESSDGDASEFASLTGEGEEFAESPDAGGLHALQFIAEEALSPSGRRHRGASSSRASGEHNVLDQMLTLLQPPPPAAVAPPPPSPAPVLSHEQRVQLQRSAVERSLALRAREVLTNSAAWLGVPAPTLSPPAWAEMQTSLRRALSSRKARRFALFEWFYSAVDRPYFEHNEFVDCLQENGMSQVTRLTRREWAHVRASMGHPRRLSRRFLADERQKLHRYRDAVRSVQQGQPADPDSGLLSPDHAPPRLLPGRRLTAVHPETRDLHRGTVVGVEIQSVADPPRPGGASGSAPASPTDGARSAYRTRLKYAVRFDDEQALGTASIADTDCMPDDELRPAMIAPSPVPAAAAAPPQAVQPPAWVAQSPLPAQFPHTDDDIRLTAELLKLLDRKKALVDYLRDMNHYGEKISRYIATGVQPARDPAALAALHPSEQEGPLLLASSAVAPAFPGSPHLVFSLQFKRQYAFVVVELEKTSVALDNALARLRTRRANCTQRTPLPLPPVTSAPARPHSVEVAELCRRKAVALVRQLRREAGGRESSLRDDGGGGGIDGFIAACMQLLLVLQSAVEYGVPPVDLDALVDALRPAHADSARVFRALEESVAFIRSHMFARSSAAAAPRY